MSSRTSLSSLEIASPSVTHQVESQNVLLVIDILGNLAEMGNGLLTGRIEPISGQYMDLETCKQLCGAQFDQSLIFFLHIITCPSNSSPQTSSRSFQ
jgi:hypothetical protein